MGWQFPQKILSCLNPQYTWNYTSQAGLASAGRCPKLAQGEETESMESVGHEN